MIIIYRYRLSIAFLQSQRREAAMRTLARVWGAAVGELVGAMRADEPTSVLVRGGGV